MTRVFSQNYRTITVQIIMHEPKEGESDLQIQKIKVREQDDVYEHMDRREFGKPQRLPRNSCSNGSVLGLSRLWASVVGEMSCGCGLSLPADSKMGSVCGEAFGSRHMCDLGFSFLSSSFSN